MTEETRSPESPVEPAGSDPARPEPSPSPAIPPLHWSDIPGWFNWRSAQEEAAAHFPPGSRFVEVGLYLGRSLCSLAEVATRSRKRFSLVGIDTCRGSGIEGPRQIDYHREAVESGGGTFAGDLHRNLLRCGFADNVLLVIADSVSAATLFADRSLAWVHLDARHDFEGVCEDIAVWTPKLFPGAWLSGDDFHEERWPEVVAAVRKCLPAAKAWSQDQWRWIAEA